MPTFVHSAVYHVPPKRRDSCRLWNQMRILEGNAETYGLHEIAPDLSSYAVRRPRVARTRFGVGTTGWLTRQSAADQQAPIERAAFAKSKKFHPDGGGRSSIPHACG